MKRRKALREERIKKYQTFSRYVMAYFVVLLAVSGAILAGVLWYSSAMLQRAEEQSEQRNMQLAADNLENQFQMMESISIQIGMTIKYRSNVLKRNSYKEIIMLEDFTKFRNYSPLSDNYFLAYRSEDKIYTCEGTTTYFELYGRSKLGIPYDQTEEVFQQILNVTSITFLYSDDYILAAFPVRFYGHGNTNSYDAILCFSLTKSQLRRYMEQVCAGLPGQYAIEVDGEWVFNNTEHKDTELTDVSGGLHVVSSDGKVRFYAPFHLKRWGLVLKENSVAFFLIVGLFGLLIFVVAFAMAHVSLRPLNRLIEKYMPDSSKFEHNFRQLDAILGDMMQKDKDNRYRLRSHLLNLILHGEYTEGLLERWSMTGLTFDRDLYCVYLVTTGGRDDADSILEQELEKLKELKIEFYVTEMESIDMIAVIACYDRGVTHVQAAEIIRLAATVYSLEVHAGRPVDSPKRLPLSMISAQTSGCYRHPSQDHMGMDFLAERLVTASLSGSQTAMEEVGQDAVRFLTNSSEGRLLGKQHLYDFMRNVLNKAEEHGIEVDRFEVNSLVLLPDIPIILNDLQKLLLEGADKSAQNRITGKDAAKLLVKYVIANAYDPDINLQEMSDWFGLSTDYISSMIKKETGFSFKEYLTMLRIAEGKRLLTEDKSLTISDVAMKVGYRKASNFSKKFKELTGIQPSQLR